MYLLSLFAGLWTVLIYYLLQKWKQSKSSHPSESEKVRVVELPAISVDTTISSVEFEPADKTASSAEFKPGTQSSQKCT